jgi:5'-methylthioadenosine nucleosidase
MQVRTIMLVVAMKKESTFIIKKLGMKPILDNLDKHLPTELYEIVSDKGRIVLVVSGKCSSHGVDRIGSQGLNLVAWEALKKFEPEILINAGTGGGFHRNGSQPGDIYISTEAIKYHDRLFYPDTFFLNYGIGAYKCLEIPFIAKRLGVKVGVISTGGSMIASSQEEKQMLDNKAAVKEMEAAGIAEVAQMRGVPFIALKIITDLVDTLECPQNQFTNNFDRLIGHLADKVYDLCSILLGENLEQIITSENKNTPSNNSKFNI